MAKSSEKPGRTGLIVFGIFEILFGLLYALMSLFMLVIPKLAPPNPQVPMPSMWPIALMMLIFSSALITLGAGTFMAKRWARKIMLILSWYMLIIGSFAILFMIFFMGPVFDNMFNSAPNVTPAVVTGIKIGMMVMMGFFYILLPGLFVLFFQSKYVLAAVEYYDPQENWMDACPTPVFAVSFFAAFGAVGMLFFGLMMLGMNFPIYGPAFPVWGVALFLLGVAATLTYIAIGFYRVDMKAWWTALFLVIIGGGAYFFMFRMMDPLSTYQQMNMPAAQIEQMKKMGMLDMFKTFSNVGWIMMTPYLAYLLFVRKYFKK